MHRHLCLRLRTPVSDDRRVMVQSIVAGALKTLQFTGSGANFSVGQNFTPAEPWPRVAVKSYTASINFDTGSMRQELVREMGTTMPRGGGAPFTGEQRQIQVVSGNFAWNLGAPAQAGGAPPPAAPQPGNAVERMLMLWATPQGFVKAAMANNATTRKAKGGTEVSFMVGGRYKMTGIIMRMASPKIVPGPRTQRYATHKERRGQCRRCVRRRLAGMMMATRNSARRAG